MIIGKYEIDGKENAAIYYGSKGMELFNIETFSPESKNIDLLSFTIKGKTYKEKKANLQEIAINYQNNFSCYSWSYGELATIYNYFQENGKRYGLIKEFKENCII